MLLNWNQAIVLVYTVASEQHWNKTDLQREENLYAAIVIDSEWPAQQCWVIVWSKQHWNRQSLREIRGASGCISLALIDSRTMLGVNQISAGVSAVTGVKGRRRSAPNGGNWLGERCRCWRRERSQTESPVMNTELQCQWPCEDSPPTQLILRALDWNILQYSSPIRKQSLVTTSLRRLLSTSFQLIEYW